MPRTSAVAFVGTGFDGAFKGLAGRVLGLGFWGATGFGGVGWFDFRLT